MLWSIARDAAGNWSNHKDARQGAALAYYSVFSIGPIIIAIAVAGLFFGREAGWASYRWVCQTSAAGGQLFRCCE